MGFVLHFVLHSIVKQHLLEHFIRVNCIWLNLKKYVFTRDIGIVYFLKYPLDGFKSHLPHWIMIIRLRFLGDGFGFPVIQKRRYLHGTAVFVLPDREDVFMMTGELWREREK